MDTSVSCQIAANVEGSSTGIASVRFLARVTPHVPFDMRGRAKRRRTFSTLIRLLLGVDSSMQGETFSLSEGRRAKFTSERFLPAVKPLMGSQIAFDGELLPTSFTRERFLACMEQHVICEDFISAEFR